jgi:hypothetical protein
VPLPFAEGDLCVGGRAGRVEKSFEPSHGAIEEEVVRVTDPDPDLAAQIRDELLPVAFEVMAEVVAFPVGRET